MASLAPIAILQADGGIPVLGPTLILVVAIAVAVGLRLLERRLGPISSWGPDRPHKQVEDTPDTSTGDATGSTAGRTTESSSSRTQSESNLGIEAAQSEPPVGAGMTDDDSGDATIRHAIGTFKTASGGGTLMVTSPGFEPDIVFLTGASKGPVSKTGFAEGWSHGIAYSAPTGGIDQYAVSIADTGVGSAGGGIREDAALDMPISAEGAGSDAVWGRVTSTVDEGFQFQVSTPAGHERTTVVQYHAVSLPDGASTTLGTFGFGTEPRKGKVDLGVDADLVSLLATTGARPLTRTPDRPVSISHGLVVPDDEGSTQASIGGAVGERRECYAAHNERGIYLLHPDEGGIAGRTSMRVTDLGTTMRLELEDVHDPAPVAFAVYVALELPDGASTPRAGLIKAPGRERGTRRRIGTPYTPASVAVTANAGAVDDRERTFDGGLPLLGWSHGTMGGTPGGLAGQVPLRSTDQNGSLESHPLGLGIQDDGFVFAAMEDFEHEMPLLLYTAWPGELEQ